MVAMDFVLGMLAAIPVSSLFFAMILPALWETFAAVSQPWPAGVFIGIEVQKRRLGS